MTALECRCCLQQAGLAVPSGLYLQTPALCEITCDCSTPHGTEQSVLPVHQTNNDTPTKSLLLLPLSNKNSNYIYIKKKRAGPKCPAPLLFLLNFHFKFRFFPSSLLWTHLVKNIPNALRQAKLDTLRCSIFLLPKYQFAKVKFQP